MSDDLSVDLSHLGPLFLRFGEVIVAAVACVPSPHDAPSLIIGAALALAHELGIATEEMRHEIDALLANDYGAMGSAMGQLEAHDFTDPEKCATMFRRMIEYSLKTGMWRP